jgi:hypothetical protein
VDSYRDEVYSERVRCGKRTYFIDVKPTQSGKDFFITISESRRVGEKFEKHKIYLYKEDFSKFKDALDRSIVAVAKSLDETGGDGAAVLNGTAGDVHAGGDGHATPEMIDELKDLSVDDREL